MDHESRSRWLTHAIRIGDELSEMGEGDDTNTSWKVITLDNNLKVRWLEHEILYNGVSGIVLFFLRLFECTNNEKYLDVAIRGANWSKLYCDSHPSHKYAFYTGRMGVSYTFLKLFEATKTDWFLDYALINAKSCDKFYEVAEGDDLLNGISGMSLGLLHLFAASGEAWVLEKLYSSVDHLLRSAHHGPIGLYWDRAADRTRGLCGMAHGTAGLGLVFLELGYYFQDSSFYWLAEQAFRYEDHFYDRSVGNWPDFRKNIYDEPEYEKLEVAYLANDLDMFTSSQDFNGWCHGAAGIALTRFRAFELLKDPIYKRDIEYAISKTITTDIEANDPEKWRTYTLCHGAGGKADVFLEAYHHFGDLKYWDLAETIAMQALRSKEEKGHYSPGYIFASQQQDTSLFMGNAGIGYFYLRLYDPEKVPSILAPKISLPRTANVNKALPESVTVLPNSNIRKTIIENSFPRTIHILTFLLPERIKHYFEEESDEHQPGEKASFVEFVEKVKDELPKAKRNIVIDIFNLESEILQMSDSIPSFTLLFVEQNIRMKRIKTTIDDEYFISKEELALNPNTQLVITKWNWDISSPSKWIENTNEEPSAHPILLMPSIDRIIEEALSPLSYAIVEKIQENKSPLKFIQEIAGDMDVVDDNDKVVVEQAIVQQLRQMLIAGILVVDKN